MITYNSRFIIAMAGWALAAFASVGLIVQHMKWREQQALWQVELAQQSERIVELELIIADLHTDIDRSGPGLNEAAAKTGSAITSVLERVRDRLSRSAEAPKD